MSMGEEREPLPPKPRAIVGGREVKLEDGEVRSETGGGWTATEVLVPENGLPDEVAGVSGVTTVADAVRADRAERGANGPSHPEGTRLTSLGQPFAMFHHPSEFTEAEDAVIVNGLMANLPLYMIAAKLNCSRNLLSKHIKESKLLSEVWADSQESFIDNVEWQAKRLIDSGNAAMIMFALERKGKDRGWGQEQGKDRGWGQEQVQETDMDDSRIVIGEIPEAEVEAAEKKVKELEEEAAAAPAPAASPEAEKPDAGKGQGSGEGQKLPSPMEMALMEDAAKRAAAEAEREREANTVNIPPDDVRVEPAPWDDGFAGGDPFDGGGFGGFM